MDRLNIRSFLTLGIVIGFIMYSIGALTQHWAETSSHNWGLWNYCNKNDTSSNASARLTTTLSHSTTTSVFVASHEKEDKDGNVDEDDDKKSNDEPGCGMFNVFDIPFDFNLVRMSVVVSFLMFAYSVFGAKLFRKEVDGSTFTKRHKDSITCLIGGSLGYFALVVFRSGYKSYNFFDTDQEEPRESFSSGYLSTGSLLIISFSVAMMIPDLLVKFCNKFSRDPFSSCSRHRNCLDAIDTIRHRHRPQTATNGTTHGATADVDQDITSISFSLNSSAVQEESAGEEDIYDYGETNLDGHSINARQNHGMAHPVSISASYGDPAPRYEDLSPREESVSADEPPPPSYSEAVSSQYDLTLGRSPPTALSPGVEPSAPPPPPPPTYSESLA